MILRVLSYILMAGGGLTMAVGGIVSFSMDSTFAHYALYFLLPGYLVALLGLCFWLNKYCSLPNVLTISRILAIPLILVLMIPGLENRATSFMACVLFCLASVTDAFDGMLARRMKVVSTIGKFLDPLADKLVYLTLLVALIPSDVVPMWLVLVVLARELFITGLRTVAVGEGMVIAASWGGKLKTIFALVGMAFLIIHHTYEVDFFVVKIPFNFHVIGLILTYISLFFCITSAIEYTYRVIKKLPFDKEIKTVSQEGQNVAN